MKSKKYKKIYLEITNCCNLSCPFCSVGKRELKNMSFIQFQHIIDEIESYTESVYLHVKGEPLLHNNLKEMLDYINNKNLKVNITTNGTLIKEKQNILLGNNSLKKINISMHSLLGIAKDKWNSYIEEVLEFALNVSKLKGRMFLFLRLWINNEEFNTYIKNKIEDYLKIKIIGNKVLDYVFIAYGEEFIWPSLDNEFITEKGRCLGTIDQLAILVNGDVTPCCLDSDGNIVLGNIFDISFDEIINSEKYIKMKNGFEKNVLNEELCQKCSYRKRFI